MAWVLALLRARPPLAATGVLWLQERALARRDGGAGRGGRGRRARAAAGRLARELRLDARAARVRAL